MTTDDQKLTELLAQKLHEVDPISGHAPRWDRLLKMDREWYRIKATAVLPIIAAEVQAAKIEVWQEGVNFALPNAETTWYPQHNPYRTTEYETGDQA